MIEALGVESIELPTYDMDIVVGGRIRQPQLAALKRSCEGRSVIFTAHGPLAINFMDEAWRLPRHFEVLKVSLDVAAEVKSCNYVLHAGVIPLQQGEGMEDAYSRQREWLFKGGELARERGMTLCVETLFTDDGKQHTPTPAPSPGTCSHRPPECDGDDRLQPQLYPARLEGRRADFIAEVVALAPFAKHLHMHDSFGRQDDIWMFTDGERLAYGHGDLHLPLGWGDIPWPALMQQCEFAPGVIFNIELMQRYWYAAADCVKANKVIATSARTRMNENSAVKTADTMSRETV